jgi:hypothetical protein
MRVQNTLYTLKKCCKKGTFGVAKKELLGFKKGTFGGSK